MGKPAETALVPAFAERTVEQERALLEKQRLRSERKLLRKQSRIAHLETAFARIKLEAARHVSLKRHMFKTEEELDGVKPPLTPQERKIIRQWEEPKKATAFGVESSAKLVEAEVRAAKEKGGISVNVDKLVVMLPDKGSTDLPKPVYIDVEAGQK